MSLFILTIIFCFSCTNSGQLIPIKLQVEGVSNPECIDIRNPRFSWQIKSETRGQSQTAFHLIVASSKENIEKNIGDMYDSGKIHSSDNTFISYQGKKLESAKIYYWKVKIWDKDNNPGIWSQNSRWTTGLIYPEDKKAKWIANKYKEIRAPLFRKEFIVNKPIKNAFAFATGMGIYYLYVNGEKLGDTFADPGMTDYKSRIIYGCYDLKQHINSGKNIIGLFLGEGMGAFSPGDKNRFKNHNKAEGLYEKPMGWFQLVLEYQDGTKQTIISDSSWKSKSSHIIYNNFYGGEDYDANIEDKDWATIKFIDKDWMETEEMEVKANLEARICPPMRIKETFIPIKAINPEPGLFCYDLGQNIGGIWRVKIKGEKGTQLKIRGSERLENSNFEPQMEPDSKLNLNHYHHAGEYYFRDCYSNYTLSGENEEIYQPSFFYSGFRYLQIETNKPESIDTLEPEGCFVYTDLQKSGDFECSDTLLNQLHKMTKYTLKGIFKSAPLSNPHSEKFGWLGDSHLFSESANFNFYMYPLWKNWLEDFRVSQLATKKGIIVSVNPPYRRKEVALPISATYGATFPITVLNTYRYYGDKQIIEKYYEGVKEWCDYLASVDSSFIVPSIWSDHGNPGISPSGDYVSRGKCPEIGHLVATAHYYKTAQIVTEMAEILNKKDDIDKYSILANNIQRSFNNFFFNKNKGIYEELPSPIGYCSIQTANLLPLQFGMVPKKYVKTVLSNVINDINSHHNGNLFTGIFGTKSLMNVLPEYGYQELLYHIIHQEDYPGYVYWIRNGATTLWEFWNGESDHMHARFGTVEEFNFEQVLGINSPNSYKTSPGFKHIHIEPWIDGNIKWAKGFLETANGKILVNWVKDGQKLKIDIEIPPNSNATLVLPYYYNSIYESDNLLKINKIEPKKNVFNKEINVSTSNQKLRIQISSGKYFFTLS